MFEDADSNAIAVSASSVITVTYTAVLNENCVVGNPGNKNAMHVEYSNNPNGDGTGTTPDDTVTVFTYKLIVNKVKEDGTTALSGAGFTLYKYDADTETYVVVGEEVGKDVDEKYTRTAFTWTGLDDGKYILEETTTPTATIPWTTFISPLRQCILKAALLLLPSRTPKEM